MRLYRESFRPSAVLAQPYTLVSVGVVADDDALEARRQTTSTAMAMLRMFQGKGYSLFPPDKVEAYTPTRQEQQVLDEYNRRFLNGTGPEVAASLEQLHAQTGVDGVMLVVMGYSRQAQARTVELIADHYRLGSPVPTSELAPRGCVSAAP